MDSISGRLCRSLALAVVSLLATPVPKATAAAEFGNPVSHTTGSGASAVVITDVDGDRNSDLVTVNTNANTVSVLHGIDSGGLAIGDFNRDGIPDLVFAKSANNAASVHLGTGSGRRDGVPDLGRSRWEWDSMHAATLPAGVYLVRRTAAGKTATQRIVVVR